MLRSCGVSGPPGLASHGERRSVSLPEQGQVQELRATGDAEPPVDALHVILDGFLGDPELPGDPLVLAPLDQQLRDDP